MLASVALCLTYFVVCKLVPVIYFAEASEGLQFMEKTNY
jgi:hypothetical protein